MIIPLIEFPPSVELTEQAIRDHADCIIGDTVGIAIEEVKEAMSEILDITFQTFLVYMIRQKYKGEEELAKK